MEVNPPLPDNVFNQLVSPLLNFNTHTIVSTWVVMLILIVFFLLVTRKMTIVPGRLQALGEMLVDGFRSLVIQSLGPERGPRYVAYFGTLFLFLLVCNIIGIFPTMTFDLFDARFETMRHIPAIEEPTKDYNTPGGLALLSLVFVAHASEIKVKGLGGYLKSYFDPFGFTIGGVVLMPLNVVGKIAEFISISFRLFGNIFGGAVIMIVVGGLVKHLVLPPFLMGFFGIFVGTIQAFVFTMLALSYTSTGIMEE